MMYKSQIRFQAKSLITENKHREIIVKTRLTNEIADESKCNAEVW